MLGTGSKSGSARAAGTAFALLLAVGAGGVLSATPAQAAPSATLYAYASGSLTPTGCPQETSDAAGCSLKTALADAVAGATILLETPGTTASYMGNWTVDVAGTSPTDELTIEADGGNAPVLDGGGSAGANGSILDITGGTDVVIEAVTFTDGYSSNGNGDGGAIDNGDSKAGGSVLVDDSTFAGNYAGTQGGAIDNGSNGGSGTMTISHSTFSNNMIGSFDGGAIDNADNGGSGTLIVTTSTFNGNSATDGGAIANGNYSGDGQLSVSDSTFSGNSAALDGGAIDQGDSNDDSTAAIWNTTFDQNGSSGGDDVYSSAAMSTDQPVAAAADIFDDSCEQSDGASWDDAGFNADLDGSCENGGPGDVTDTADNVEPLANHGGETAVMPPRGTSPTIRLVPPDTSVTLAGTSVMLCPTTDQRGVPSVPGQPCNAGAVNGGELFAYAEGNNSASAGCPATASITGGCGLAQSLGAAVPGDTLYLGTAGSDGSYTGSFELAESGGGPRAPITIEPAPGVLNPILDGAAGDGNTNPILGLAGMGEVDILGSTYQNADNQTTPGGGAIAFAPDSDVSLDVAGSTFTNDVASGSGGAISSDDDPGAVVTVDHSKFNSDTAGTDGGAIAVPGGVLEVSHSTFSNDTASNHGGAIDAGDVTEALATVDTSSFSANSAHEGGAINIGDTAEGIGNISDSEFSDNTASNHGGAIDLGDHTGSSQIRLTGSTFVGNTSIDDGGAIDNDDNNGNGSLTVESSTFQANQAGRSGGGIDNGDDGGFGTLTVSDSTFNANTTSTGDGGAIDNSDDGGAGTVTLTDSTLVGNSAEDGGGIDESGGGIMSVSATTFAANKATTSGPTIYAADDGTADVAADVFDGSCAHDSSTTWNDAGFNAGTDSSCLSASPANSDVSTSGVAKLGSLGSYGGSTKTVPLLAGNPALNLIPTGIGVGLNGINTVLCPVVDQRGVSSASGVKCSAGAVQSIKDSAAASASPASSKVGGTVILKAKLTPAKTLSNVPLPAGTITFAIGSKQLCHTSQLTFASGSSAATASCTTKKLPKGTDHITATYTSSDSYLTAVATTVAHVTAPKKPKKTKKH